MNTSRIQRNHFMTISRRLPLSAVKQVQRFRSSSPSDNQRLYPLIERFCRTQLHKLVLAGRPLHYQLHKTGMDGCIVIARLLPDDVDSRMSMTELMGNVELQHKLLRHGPEGITSALGQHVLEELLDEFLDPMPNRPNVFILWGSIIPAGDSQLYLGAGLQPVLPGTSGNQEYVSQIAAEFHRDFNIKVYAWKNEAQ